VVFSIRLALILENISLWLEVSLSTFLQRRYYTVALPGVPDCASAVPRRAEREQSLGGYIVRINCVWRYQLRSVQLRSVQPRLMAQTDCIQRHRLRSV
jgi:hypothetical protein